MLLKNLNSLEKTATQQLQQGISQIFILTLGTEPRSIMANVLKDCVSQFQRSNEAHPLFIIATTDKIDQVSGPLRGCFRQELVLEVTHLNSNFYILRVLMKLRG